MNDEYEQNEEVASSESDIEDNQESQILVEILDSVKGVSSTNVETVQQNADLVEDLVKVNVATNVSLVIVIALLVLLIGMKFGDVLTRFWRNK